MDTRARTSYEDWGLCFKFVYSRKESLEGEMGVPGQQRSLKFEQYASRSHVIRASTMSTCTVLANSAS